MVVVVVGAWWVHGTSSGSGSAVGAGPGRSGSARPGESDAPLSVTRPPAAGFVVVHVAGQVRRPGVYRLRSSARVQDAVKRAGGARAGADLDALNLAAKLTDGRQVVVGRRIVAGSGGGVAAGIGAGVAAAGAGTGVSGAAGAGGATGAPVSLNSAGADELGTLDGVGPATAAKIIAYREEHGGFGSVDELDQVPGIGPKKLAALRERVTT